MTKKLLLLVCFALSAFNLLHAQKDSSIQAKQFSLETGNLFALKQKIVNEPSLSWLAIFFDNIYGGGPDSRMVKFPSFTITIK